MVDIDQSPIGRTPRSNPATYTKVFDPIRELFALTTEARARGYMPGRFSFNVKGGRCEACQGDGQIKIEMHFLPDVYVTCEVCKGKRYDRETLEVRYKGSNIAEVLDLTVEQARDLFAHPKIAPHPRHPDRGRPRLHQARPAGDHPVRRRGAADQALARAGARATGSTLYILDEPTTGLHFDDVKKLLRCSTPSPIGATRWSSSSTTSTSSRRQTGSSTSAPRAARAAAASSRGTPEQIAAVPASFTGHYLAPLLETDAKRRSA